MSDQGYGNFAFLYNINREIYDHIQTAETLARLDFEGCGKELRLALESFINSVITGKKLNNHFRFTPSLWEKIDLLSSEQDMRAAGYLQLGQTFDQKPLLPRMGTVKYTTAGGTEKTADYYDFLREYSNQCSHAQHKPYQPKICFANVLNCLKGYYLLFSRFYSSRLPKNMPAFNEDLMLIGNYIILKAWVPEDKDRSQCVKEFWGYIPDTDGSPRKYALIRMYNRTQTDSNFMLRNQRCFTEASKVSLSSIPEGMANLRELTPTNRITSDNYLISYEFNRSAEALSAPLLNGLTMEQRLDMCCRLVQCLDNLHNSETPIYHRMLNYDCIYISRFRNILVPYIVKFDYSKIVVTTRQLGTVYEPASNAKKRTKSTSLSKYIAPEWDRIDAAGTGSDWAKVDVYSLGVLICDILAGRLGTEIPSLDDLADMDVPELVLDILDGMLAESPGHRCTMAEVREVFEAEVR